MPLLKYTTRIDYHKTVWEIQVLLAEAGASGTSVDYDDNAAPQSVSFVILVNDQFVNFRLPSNYAGVLKIIQEENALAKRLQTEEQAKRIAWRITKAWIEAQLSIVEVDQAALAEVFLPYAVTSSGLTLYQQFEQGRLLGDGET